MSVTYAQKQSPAQKKDANTAASVVDCSSQGEALQRKADFSFQCKTSSISSMPVQRKLFYKNIEVQDLQTAKSIIDMYDGCDGSNSLDDEKIKNLIYAEENYGIKEIDNGKKFSLENNLTIPDTEYDINLLSLNKEYAMNHLRTQCGRNSKGKKLLDRYDEYLRGRNDENLYMKRSFFPLFQNKYEKMFGNLKELFSKTKIFLCENSECLRGSWYFNSENQKEIFASGGIISAFKRSEDAKKSKEKILKKTMGGDSGYGTDDYVYFFMETDKSRFNVNTRFAKPATENGGLSDNEFDDSSKRRLRVPLKEIVRRGGIMMGDDFTTLSPTNIDRLKRAFGENCPPAKEFLKRNRLLGEGSVSEEDVADNMKSFISDYVEYAFSLLFFVCEKLRKDKKSLHNAELSCGYLQKVISAIEKSIGSGDVDGLVVYLNRNVAKAQLMVPREMPFVKGMTVDSPDKDLMKKIEI